MGPTLGVAVGRKCTNSTRQGSFAGYGLRGVAAEVAVRFGQKIRPAEMLQADKGGRNLHT